jgi:formate dehydrogenase iron-sulfur subunit
MSGASKIYVPREAAAVSLGADEVAELIAAAAAKSNADVQIVRNGSWGITWLEPMVEVAVDGQRFAYGPVTPDDVDGLIAAGLFDGADHELKLGLTANIDWLKNQMAGLAA